MQKDIIIRQCKTCGWETINDGISELLCLCDENDELEEMFSESLAMTEQAISDNHSTNTGGEDERI